MTRPRAPLTLNIPLPPRSSSPFPTFLKTPSITDLRTTANSPIDEELTSDDSSNSSDGDAPFSPMTPSKLFSRSLSPPSPSEWVKGGSRSSTPTSSPLSQSFDSPEGRHLKSRASERFLSPTKSLRRRLSSLLPSTSPFASPAVSPTRTAIVTPPLSTSSSSSSLPSSSSSSSLSHICPAETEDELQHYMLSTTFPDSFEQERETRKVLLVQECAVAELMGMDVRVLGELGRCVRVDLEVGDWGEEGYFGFGLGLGEGVGE